MRSRLSLLPVVALAGALHANAWGEEDSPPVPSAPEAEPETASPAANPTGSQLVWTLGLRLRASDLAAPGDLSPRPIIGLRYGRWRTGPVNSQTWHRFGQIRTDNALTYDWLDSANWRTALSASVINLQKDSPTEVLEPGRKTVRGRATIDYLGWSHWSVGLILTQDLLDRGAGTALSPNITYRQALDEDTTLLLSQSVTWATAGTWRTMAQLAPQTTVHQGRGWGSVDTSVTLRQRWKPRWSWYAQIHRNQVIGPVRLGTDGERTHWSAQAGVLYFSR